MNFSSLNYPEMNSEDRQMFIDSMEPTEMDLPKENSSEEKKDTLLAVNPYAIGGGFLMYCIAQGWIIREGVGHTARYFITKNGITELAKFGIFL